MTRARYRRRYGTDMPEASIAVALPRRGSVAADRGPGQPAAGRSSPASPARLRRAYATPYPQRNRFGRSKRDEEGERHYSYEDEDQSGERGAKAAARRDKFSTHARRTGRADRSAPRAVGGQHRQLLRGRGGAEALPRPKLDIPEPTGKTGLRQGSRVRHPKYGEGTVFRREGDGDDAKITVQFQQHGVKKLVEKFAQLEAL